MKKNILKIKTAFGLYSIGLAFSCICFVNDFVLPTNTSEEITVERSKKIDKQLVYNEHLTSD